MAYLQRIHPARIIPLMIAALATVAAFSTAINAAPVTNGPRYLVDARGGGQAFVVAYDALEYSVDGGEAVAVLADDVGVVDLSAVTGPFAEIRLSSEAGYVVNVANDADYTGDNTSNDQMILARGRDRYVDTEFLVYNHVPTVNNYNPAKIIVTAQEATAEVTVSGLTGGMGTSVFEVELGQSTVLPLSESALLSITTDGAPVSVYYGILNDGAVEVVPTTSGGFIGTEAYVATPEFVGVVATGTGFIHITERVINGGTEYDRTLLERSVITGEALYVKTAHATTGLFDGVTTVKVSGTAPFYAFAGIGSAFSTYYGSTFIPAVPGSNGMRYRVQTLHPERASYLDVAPLDVGTTVTVSKTERGVVVGTVAPTSTDNGVYTYQLPASQTRQANVAAGYAKTVYLVQATGPIVVHERHAATVERGGIAISPDYEPQVPPSIGELDVTAIRVLDEGNWIVDERLRVAFNAIDVNGDLQSVVLTDPTGATIDLTDHTTTIAGGVDVNTDWDGIAYAYIPGTYTLTATDMLGMETVRVDSIRDVSVLDITAAQVNQPDNGSAGTELLPVYSWISPRFEYASYYRFSVNADETFGDAGQVIIPFSAAKIAGKVSAAHASYATALNQDDLYGWRVMGVASTLRWGDDFAVIGPVWTFSTSDAEDTSPPQFIRPPRVTNVTMDTVRVGWTTNEPTTAVVNVFALDGTPQTSIDVVALSDENMATFVVGSTDALIWKLVVEITDQSGNTAQSDELLFHIEEEPDTADPLFMAGPAHVSVTDVKATLTWTTNEPTAWVVHHWVRGVDPISQPDQISTKQDLETLQLSRQVDLTNLIPDTLYSYQVQVVDASSNVTYSRIQQFRTPAGPDTRPPGIIGQPVVRDRTATSALITWRTDEGAIGKVRYGLADDPLNWSAGNPSAGLTTNHEIRLTDLTSATQYFFAAHSIDASRNTSISDTLSFVTLSIPDTEGPRIRPAGQGGVDKGTVVINRSDRMPVAKWNTNEDHTAVITVSSDPVVGEDGVFSNQAATVKVYSVT
ncbi:MAG TPA: hypothetical protein ENN56_04820, partial [Firmicutes bacterium]|nr:hypothetical protein [Bacillota bacterium]